MTYRLGFVMEQTWGHATHRRNLAAHLAACAARDAAIESTWIDVPYHADDLWSRLPLVRGNWSLRGGLRARAALRRALRERPLDGVLFHTQVTALCSRALLRRLPSVISLDATPLNLDTVAQGYAHRPEACDPLGRLKRAWNGAILRAAAALAPWSEWARQSLIEHYGVPHERTTVVPPGVDLRAWRPGRWRADGPTRLLFVGGEFARKGGHDLLAVVSELPACEVDVVTRDRGVRSAPRVRVHVTRTPNDEALRRLYREADVFVLPTRADCMPLAILEAMASGLPVVSTRVGAIPEQVQEGVTGLLVRPGDRRGLAAALRTFLDSRRERARMGRAGRERAEARFDAARNYGRLVDLLRGCVDARRADPAAPEVARAA